MADKLSKRADLPLTVRIDLGLAQGQCLIWDERGRCRLQSLATLDFDPGYRLLLISPEDAAELERRCDSDGGAGL